ncbi:hypothetical protein EXIGLDRAFT_732375 [Exidia glandulosa HHB12029]|uniref:Yeast cell wall synthesis Kre9/Knh1-like N-terminal domain-containing protein n=1 Tax=Exidia glandulosa HHB12029 TaxID=1314781 RepID=A0A166B0G0_EXIGL|nr:hypothetical protein EXIGLDRAFT_732375 [Exidia glandulosa HHB12029]
MLAAVAILAASLALVRADIEPSEPSPGRDFQIGGDCEISWTPDPAGAWGLTSVELMTGSNDQMIHLSTVYQFDAKTTTATSYTYPCPDVSPHSAIYFYQFTAVGMTGQPTWTGRFSISNNHDLVPPENTEADGTQWGTGALTNPALAVAAPPTSPQYSGAAPADPASTSTPTTPASTPTTPDQTTDPATPTKTNPGQGHPIPPVGGPATAPTSSQDSSAAESSTPADNTGAASSLRASMSALALVGAVALAAL